MKNNIQEIIDKLIPLYNTGNEDLPDQPLWQIRILVILLKYRTT